MAQKLDHPRSPSFSLSNDSEYLVLAEGGHAPGSDSEIPRPTSLCASGSVVWGMGVTDVGCRCQDNWSWGIGGGTDTRILDRMTQ